MFRSKLRPGYELSNIAVLREHIELLEGFDTAGTDIIDNRVHW